MRYFYLSAENQAVGPLEGEALVALRRQGVIGDDTRVAPEGEAVWHVFADFYRPGVSDSTSSALPLPPVSIRVFGICNIVFGSLGLLCMPVTAGLIAAVILGKTQEVYEPLHNAWLVFTVVLGVFLAGGLLLSGIGLCRFREWGRKLALACAGVDVVESFISFGVNLTTSPLVVKHQFDCTKHWLGVALFVFLLVIGLAYPVALLVMLRRRGVREAFLGRE